MRIRLFAKTLLAVLFCSTAFAAAPADPERSWHGDHRMAFSIDPIVWTSGNLSFQYEVAMNDRMSFNMPLRFGFDKAIFNNNYFRGSYFAPRFGVKYYVTGKSAHQGFYVNPLIGVFFGKATGAADATGAVSYGFRFGYGWNICHGLWLDSYFGYETYATSFNSKGNSNGEGTAPGAESSGIFPGAAGGGFNAGMMIGYVW